MRWVTIITIIITMMMITGVDAMTIKEGVEFQGLDTRYTTSVDFTFSGDLNFTSNHLSFGDDGFTLTPSAGNLNVSINGIDSNTRDFNETPSENTVVEHNMTGLDASTPFYFYKDFVSQTQVNSDVGGLLNVSTDTFNATTNWLLQALSCEVTHGSGTTSVTVGGGDIEYFVEINSTDATRVFCDGLGHSNTGDCNYAPRWDITGIKPYQMVSNVTYARIPYSNSTMNLCNVTYGFNKSGNYIVPTQFDPILADENLTIINPRLVTAIKTNYRVE